MNNNENESLEVDDDVYFEITDEDDIKHKVKLLTIFTAGDLKKEYAAVLNTDITIFRCVEQKEDNVFIVENTFAEEYEEVANDLDNILENSDGEDIVEGTFYSSDSEEPVYGLVYSILEKEKYNHRYLAIQLQDIMFYRYEVDGLEDDSTVTLSQIYSSKEYEDVMFEFQKYVID